MQLAKWFLHRLIVLSVCWGLLGTSALPAEVKHPFRCVDCCQNCGGGEWFVKTARSSTPPVNLLFNRQKPARQQLLVVATNIVSYATNQQQNGALPKAEAAFLQSLETFYNTQGSGATAYNDTTPYGNTVSAKNFQTLFNTMTLQQKQQFVALIQAYEQEYGAGNAFYNLLLNYATAIQQIAHGEVMPENWNQVYFDGMAATGGLMMAIPGMEGFGVIFFLGGTIGIMYCDGWGC
jgi:hypothetical protein